MVFLVIVGLLKFLKNSPTLPLGECGDGVPILTFKDPLKDNEAQRSDAANFTSLAFSLAAVSGRTTLDALYWAN